MQSDEEFLAEKARIINDLVTDIKHAFLEVGRHLSEIRDRNIEAHRFEKWLSENFRWSRQYAYSLISVYKKFGSNHVNASLHDLTFSHLRILASIENEDTREKIMVKSIEENLSTREVQKLVQEAKPPRPPSLPNGSSGKTVFEAFQGINPDTDHSPINDAYQRSNDLMNKLGFKITAGKAVKPDVGELTEAIRAEYKKILEEINGRLNRLIELGCYIDQMHPLLRHTLADSLNGIKSMAETLAKNMVGGNGDLRKITRPHCNVEIPLRVE